MMTIPEIPMTVTGKTFVCLNFLALFFSLPRFSLLVPLRVVKYMFAKLLQLAVLQEMISEVELAA